MKVDGLPTNPEDMPTDPNEIAKMLGEDGGATDSSEGAESSDAGVSSDTKEDGNAVAAKAEGEEDAGKKAGDETADTKYLPISAVHQARVRARNERLAREEAERKLAEANARLEELTAKAAAGGDISVQAAEGGLSDEEIAEIEESFPMVAKAIRAQQDVIRRLSGQVETVAKSEQERQSTVEAEASNSVQQLIDANPVLSFFQNEDPDRWQRAVQLDNAFRADPLLADLTVEQRFDKVVQTMETMYGKVDLPPEYVPQQQQKISEPSKKEIEERARKAMEQAPGAVPHSLSDLPGGMQPANSEAEKFENMDAATITNMFSNMTPEQIDTALSRLA